MDQALQKLIRQLRSEKCPPTVLDQVARRIAPEKTPARSGSWRPSLAWAVSFACIACLLGAAALGLWQTHREAQRIAAELAATQVQSEATAAAQAQTQAQRALVRQQTQVAFGYIGQALLRAAAHTENALSKEAVPSLRNSFDTVINKVTDPI